MDSGPELFRSIVEASTDGLWIFDLDGRTLYANDRMAQILGRTPEEMAAGFNIADALDDEGRAQLRDHLRDMREGEEGEENLDSMFVRADGTATWGLVSWSPMRDAEGRRTGWLHRVTPYTERRELMRRLQEREQQLVEAQAMAHVGSWEWDVVDDVVTWTDELHRIFAVDPQEHDATYGGFLEFVHPDELGEVRRAIEATWQGADEFRIDHRIVNAAGEVRHVRSSGRVWRGPDGVPVRMGGTTQDVTEVRLADEVAAEATRRLQLLQAMAMAANEASSLLDAVEVASGKLPQNAMGWAGIGVYVVDDDSSPLTRISAKVELGIGPVDELAETARRSGRIEHMPAPDKVRSHSHSVVAMPVTAHGEVVCVIELMADEAPPDENSFRLMTQVVGQLNLVAERERTAAQLAEARDEAMEASRLKSEFLATMSHEIRTPMNGVIGLNDLLLRTDLDDHQRRLAEGLQSAGLTLLALINDILDLSKIESGKLELEEADFDVRAAFDQVATVLGGPAHEQGLELVVACHPDVPMYLKGDATRLGQVLSNLGANAVKFTDHGEVLIQAELLERTPTGVLLRVDVTDTGIGISPTALEQLFDAFTQADLSTTRRHGGTGLGLAISQQLVRAMGGELWVTSEVGRGSTFSFTARLDNADSAPARRFGTPRALDDRRVLVVDDNATNRFILTEQLAAWNTDTVAVANAEEVLAELRRAAEAGEPFEVAILDHMMPGVDGVQLAQMIRRDPSLGQPTMLLLSSDQSIGPAAARAAGFRTALSKPLRHTELHDVLVSVLAAGRDEPAPHRGLSLRPRRSLDAHVLVVEDNQINQLVATGLLEDLGCRVAIANDGVEALDLLAGEHEFDAVLMDCRMPRLDGFDATRRIRNREDPNRRVPVIAMTASALSGERERCLAVGMDDFLTKPVDVAALEQTMIRWINRPGPEASATPLAAVAPRSDTGSTSDPGPVIDTARIQMLDQLVKDGVSFFQRTSTSFLGRIHAQLDDLGRALADGDAQRAAARAHAMKGSAANLGLPRVAAAAGAIEARGHEGITADSQRLLDRLVTEVDSAVEALEVALGVTDRQGSSGRSGRSG